MVVSILTVLVTGHGKKVSMNDPVPMRSVCSMSMLIARVKMESWQKETSDYQRSYEASPEGERFRL